jgi:MFS family permease
VARRRLLLDLRPLRASPDFRRLYLGTVVSQVGGMMTVFAVALQVYQLTHSSAAVGLVGLAAGVPTIVVGILGGPLVDAVDRRALVLVASVLLAGVSALFAAQAFAGWRSLGLLYGLVAVQNVLMAVSGPARRTFTPRLLPPSLLPAGAALSMLAMHVSAVLGPPLAGVLAATAGLKICYLVDAVSFGAALYGVARLPAMRPEQASGRGPRAVAEGLRFIARERPVLGALLSDLAATALAFPVALFPAMNDERFGGSPRTLGLLSAGLAVGGILGTTFSGRVSHTRAHGRAMLVAVTVWGGALIGVGLAHSLVATLAWLAVAGAADVLSVVFRTSLVQTVTPDRFRGRVSAAESVVGAGGPAIGGFRAGMVAAATGPGPSAVIGGAASLVATAALTLGIPALRRWRAPSDAPPGPAAGHEPSPASSATP